MDELTQKVYVRHVAQEAVRNRSLQELRGLQLMAYTSVTKAVRAEGKLDERRKKFLGEVMTFFDITRERHATECRRVAAHPELCRLAQGISGDDGTDSWRKEGYGMFAPLPPFHRRSGNLKECLAKEAEPPPKCSIENEGVEVEEISDTEEYKVAAKLFNSKVRKVHKKIQTIKIVIKKEKARSSSEEEESSSDVKMKQENREQSPDITETPPTTPVKNKPMLRDNCNVKRARGAKRKIPLMMSRKANTERESPPLKKANLKHKRALKFPKGKPPKIKFVRKRPPSESSGHASSDEEPSNNKTDETTVPDSVEIKVKAPSTRGRGLTRVRGRGVRGRGSGRGRIASNVNHEYRHPSEERTFERMAPNSPTKTLKVLKPKKPKTVSVSRRKSRLKEKEDDEMQMEWNDDGYDDDRIIMSNKRIPIKKRKHFPEDSSKADQNPTTRDNILVHANDFKNGEVDEHLHHSHDGNDNDRHSFTSDMLGRGDASSSRHSGGNVSGEETDSASEKGSISGSRSVDSSGNNHHTRVSLSPPPVKQKQRLKTPLVVPSSGHAQLPRINLPPPVFSTSLSSVQKKRPPKHISVVDSLNLHLPTTATASSLAASSSSRRPSIMGGSSGSGCSMFSNSQALLANSRGVVPLPGILQNQRKANPHILVNSKVHQRSFTPTSNNNNNISNSINVSVSVSGNSVNLSSNNSIVNSAGTIMTSGVHQVQNTIMSSMSQSPAAVAVQLPGLPGTPIAMSGTIPIGAIPVSRAPGTNIIFLQKATNPTNVVSSSVGMPTSSMPVKTPSRAVILRRTQLPRQGNVMFVDVQKNQVMNAGQVPQFLQTRILNPPTELSVLNLQGVQAPRKIIQPQSFEHSEPNVAYSMAPVHNQRKTKVTGVQQVVSTATPINVISTSNSTLDHVSTPVLQPKEAIPVNTNANTQSQRDSQMAEIEAQLMQMEGEVVYEEEVVTSSDASELIATVNQLRDQGVVVEQKQPPFSINVNSVNSVNPYVSGSSTDTASEGETSLTASLNNTPESLKSKSVEISLTQQLEVRQMSDALTRAIVSTNANSSPPKRNISNAVVVTNENSGNHNSENCSVDGEDIFQAALKSSGIVFPDQQYFSSEDISTNVEQLQPTNQIVATNNYTSNNQQGNGAALQ